MIDATRGDAREDDAPAGVAYEDYVFPVLRVGMRVRLHAPIAGLSLRSDTGTVVRPDEDDGYYVVRLDEPARSDHGVGRTEELAEVVVASDNLDIVAE